MRSRFRRASGVLHVVLVALLLVPTLLHGHRHPASDTPASCALCVATHHTPAVQAAPLAAPAPVARAVALTFVPDLPSTPGARRPHTGRGPPLALAPLSV
jgi:hypothetical protein